MRRALLALLLFALAPVFAASPMPQTRPWRIAVSGGYSTGYLGLLALHGMPRSRIDDTELTNLDRLRQFDVVIAGWRNAGSPEVIQTMEQYVREGGIAFTESVPPLSYDVLPGRRIGPAPSPNLRFVEGDHPVLKGLSDLGLISVAGLQGMSIVPAAGSKAIVLARYTDEQAPPKSRGIFWDGNQGAPAILLVPYGKGYFVYSGCSVAFSLALRGRQFEQLLCNVLDYLSQGQLRDRMFPGNLEQSELVTLRPTLQQDLPYPAPAGAAQAPPKGLDVLEEAANLRDFCLSGKLPASGTARVLIGFWSPRDMVDLTISGRDLALRTVVGGKPTARRLSLAAGGGELLITRRQGLLTLRYRGETIYNGCPAPLRQGLLACQGLTDASYQPLAPITFDDDFMREAGFTGDWEAQSGTWQVVASEGKPEMGVNPFDYQVNATGEAISLTGNWFWSDYSAAVSFRAASQSAGLIAHYQGPKDFLLLRLVFSPKDPAASKVQLLARSAAGDKLLAETKVRAGVEDWHRLELRTARGRLQGLLDGAVVVQSGCAPAAGGQVGLYCQQGPASFDDVRVAPWVATTPSLVPEVTDFLPPGTAFAATTSSQALGLTAPDGVRLLAPWAATDDLAGSVRVKLGQAEAAGMLLRASPRSFVLLTLVRSGAGLRLRAFRQGVAAAVLADKAIPGKAADWHSLGAACYDYHLQATVDGKPALDLLETATPGGTVGLYARGTRPAQFQDFRAWQSTSPEHVVDEPTPVFAGIIDRHTWAGRSGAWTSDPAHLNCFWHQGYFPGAVRLDIGVHPSDQAETTTRLHLSLPEQADKGYTLVAVRQWSQDQVRLTLQRQGQNVAEAVGKVKPGQTYELGWQRAGSYLVATVESKPVLAYRDPQPLTGLEALGLDNGGQMLYPEDVAVYTPLVHDYTFETAPTDWAVESGTWKVSSRWSCTPGWSWFSGYNTQGPALIASKQNYQGDQEIVSYFAAKMMPVDARRYSETLSDLHLGCCAESGNAAGGYHLVIGGDANTWTGLLKDGKLVASSPFRITQNGIHNDWLKVVLRKRGNHVTASVWDTPILDYQDPAPLSSGHIALGTQRNGILVPRITIFGEQVEAIR